MIWCMAGGQLGYGFSMQCIHEEKNPFVCPISLRQTLSFVIYVNRITRNTEPVFGVFLAYLQRIETEQQ